MSIHKSSKRSHRKAIIKDGYALIPIGNNTKDGYAKIDLEFIWLEKYRWNHDRIAYASATINGKSVKMHRLIMKAPKGLDVDHINMDGLDNRTSNLRICTRSQNMANSPSKGGVSGYKGVYKAGNRWTTKLKINWKSEQIGTFATKEEAAIAYNKRAKEIWGEFAYQNIIRNPE